MSEVLVRAPRAGAVGDLQPARGPQRDDVRHVRGAVRGAARRPTPTTRCASLVLRGAGEKAFVAGTDIRQFADFDETGEDALAYEATIDRIVGRLETVAQADRRAGQRRLRDGLRARPVGPPATCASARPPRPVRAPDRAHGRELHVDGELRPAGVAARAGAAQGHRLHHAPDRDRQGGAGDIGLATEVARAGTRSRHQFEELCEQLTSHAPVTLRATKEALRRASAR